MTDAAASSKLSPAGFLNTLAREAGCGLLLDVYNLQCDEANHGLHLDGFFEELDLAAVGEVHVANGVKRRGFQLDVHSGLTDPSTVALGGGHRTRTDPGPCPGPRAGPGARGYR